jgi:hypothetical protein
MTTGPPLCSRELFRVVYPTLLLWNPTVNQRNHEHSSQDSNLSALKPVSSLKSHLSMISSTGAKTFLIIIAPLKIKE